VGREKRSAQEGQRRQVEALTRGDLKRGFGEEIDARRKALRELYKDDPSALQNAEKVLAQYAEAGEKLLAGRWEEHLKKNSENSLKWSAEIYSKAAGLPTEEAYQRLSSGSVKVERAEFMSKAIARMSIENEIPNLCDSGCETNVAWNIVAALSLWKSSCLLCSDDFLSLVSVGKMRWIDSRILDWLRGPEGMNPDSFPFNGNFSSVFNRANAKVAAASPASQPQFMKQGIRFYERSRRAEGSLRYTASPGEESESTIGNCI
jgi:hypothetical protein